MKKTKISSFGLFSLVLFIFTLLSVSSSLAAPIPNVTTSGGGSVFITEAFQVTADFDNLAGTTTGFNPMYLLKVPAGMTFNNATYLGAAVSASNLYTCAVVAGCTVSVPDIYNAAGGPSTVTIANGESLYVLRYPLGSFTTTQPAQRMLLNFTLSSPPTANLGVPLNLKLTPFFSLGATPILEAGDPSILGTERQVTVNPSIIRHTKTISAPEAETATGPNYTRTATLTVDIATGATVDTILVTDVLDPGMQFVAVTSAAGFAVTPPAVNPGGSLIFNLAGPVTGVAGIDRTITYTFYVPKYYNGGVLPVLDLTSGASKVLTNNSTLTANYPCATCVPADPPQTANASASITARSIAIQKSAAIFTDLGAAGLSPTDTLQYTLSGQVSDYFQQRLVNITDTLGDGQTFLASFTPTWTVTSNGVTTSGTFTLGSNYTVAPKTGAGLTVIAFNLSAAMGGAGLITGDNAGVGNPLGQGQSTFTIRLRSTVDSAYVNAQVNTRLLTVGDSVSNNVSTQATVNVAGGGSPTDGSATTLTIANPAVIKSVYAYNGSTTIPSPFRVKPGDTVTYRLRIPLIFTSYELMSITDFLPVPFLLANEMTIGPAAAGPTALVPPAGQWYRGPTDTLSGTNNDGINPPVTVAVSKNVTQNTLTWNFGTFEAQSGANVIDILFTVTASNEPLADSLNLANLAILNFANSSNTTSSSAVVENLTTDEPQLTIEKVITSISNPSVSCGVFPSTSCSNADAGDTVDYRITVTNTGTGPAYNIRLNDDATSAANFGAGNCVILTAPAGSGDLFDTTVGGGYTLTNPLASLASVTFTYRGTVAATRSPGPAIANTATITNFTSTAPIGSPNYATNPASYSSSTTLALRGVQSITKAITGSSVPGTTSPNINQGETLTFTIIATLGEGTYTNFSLTDDHRVIPSPVTCGINGFSCSGNVNVVGTTVTVTGTAGNTPGTISYTYTSGPLTASGTNIATVAADNQTSQTASRSWTLVQPAWALIKTFPLPIPLGDGGAGSELRVRLQWRNTNAASPLYQAVISDVLPASLFDWGIGATADVTPAGYTFAYNAGTGTVTYTQNDLNTAVPAAPAGYVTASFRATIKSTVITGSTYTNTESASGRTLPLAAENASGGTITGSTSANYTVPASAAASKVLTATSLPNTAGTDVAIGETFTYALTFNLPSGTTQSVILSDVMTAGYNGVTLVGATLARGNTSLNAATNPNGINAAGAGVPVDVFAQMVTCPAISAPNCPAANMFTLPLGNVTNTSGATATYTLTVTQRVSNVAVNIEARALSDRARIYYNNATGTQQNAQSAIQTATVRLPVVTVGKTVLPASPASGDTVTYRLTVRNTGTIPGFDWTFSDVLPVQLINPGSIVTDNNGTGWSIGAAFTGNTLNGTINQLDPGQEVYITYQAQINPTTAFGFTMSNSATARTTSLPGVDANERTGAGPSPNNLFAATNAPLTTSTPTLAKAVITPQARYAIGDIVHYRLTLSVPVGTSTGMSITDQFPAGLAFLNTGAYVPIITKGAGISTIPAISTVSEAAGLVTATLGSVTAASAGAVTLDYYAQVRNVILNQEGLNLTNNARATYNNPNIPPGGTLSTTATPQTITVGEPVLAMTKTILSGGVGADAGRVVRWQFTVENTGTTTAWQTNIRDQLPNGITNISGVTLGVSGGLILNSASNPVGLSDVAISTTVNANDTLALNDIRISSGAVLTIQFDAVVMNTVVPAQVLNNIVTATFASQQSGSSGTGVVRDGADGIGGALNDYAQSASNAITIRSNIAIDKQADKTTATIGEMVLYTIRVSVIQGVTPSVSVNDTLPVGLTYVSHVISVGNIPMTFGNATYNTRLGAGQVVGFNLGNVSNPANAFATDDYFDIAITARVDNIAGNQNGNILSNGAGGTVTVTYGTVPTTVTYDYDLGTPGIQGRPLTLTEPELVVSKTAVPAVQALGSVVTYEVTVMHDSGSSEDAWDLVLDDVLPVGMTYVPGSATLPPGDVTVAGQNMQFRIGSLPLLTHDITFYYSAAVNNSAAVGVPLINSINLVWSSLSGATGAADNGRTGSGGVNDYTTSDNSSVTPATPAFVRAPKTVAIVVDGSIAGQLDPLDTLEYTIVLRNAGVSQATNVVYTDAIPSNTTYVAASLTTTQGAIVPGFPLQVNVGTMDPLDIVTITFQVTVNAGTPVGTIISNQGSVDSDQTVPRPTDDDDIDANGLNPTTIIVGPRPVLINPLYAEKWVTWLTDADTSGTVTPGDTLRYTIIVENRGNANLTGVRLDDTIPLGLTYVPASLTVTLDTPAGSAAITGQALSWAIGGIAVGVYEYAVFDVTIDGPPLPGSVSSYAFINQGSADSDQTPPTPTDGNGIPEDGYQPTTITAVDGAAALPDLDVQKSWSLAVDLTGNGVVSPGDTIQYQITTTNTGSTPATDVRLADPIPVAPPIDTTVVAGSVTTSQGVVLTETPSVSINIGTVNPGQVITVRFRVVVDPGLLVDGIIPNQTTVSSAELPDVNSDDNGNPFDGLNPTLTPVDVTGTGIGDPSGFYKNLVNTSELAGSSGNQVLIGEVLTFELGVTMPEGVLQQAAFQDTLPAGLTYVAGSGLLAREFDTGMTAAANPGGVNSALSGVFVSLTDGSHLTLSGQTLQVALGDVVNSDNDSGAERYVLHYQAVVANIAGNQTGTALTNSATFTYLDALSMPGQLGPDSETVTILEPAIQISKSANPATIPASGATVSYSVVVTNPAALNVGPAYDVIITDTPGSGLSNIVLAQVIPGGGVSGIDSSNTTPLILDIRVGTFPPDGTLTILYTAEAAPAAASPDVSNTVNTTWTSVPGTNGTGDATPGASGSPTGERNGDDGIGGALNDYAADADAEVTYKLSRRAISFEDPFCVPTCNNCVPIPCPAAGPHYIAIPDALTLNLTTQGSIEAWIKPSSFNADAGIVVKGTTSLSYGFGLAGGTLFPGGTAQNICFRVGATILLADTYTLEPSKWHHVACVWDNTGMQIYIDGVLRTSNAVAAVAPANNEILMIGRQEITPAQYLGSVEEFRIWNTARSVNEIRDFMCRTVDVSMVPPPMADLICYLRCDESSGTGMIDACGNGNNGVITDAVRICSSAPIGDTSDHDYYDELNTYSLSLTSGAETFSVDDDGGTWNALNLSGIHLYQVGDIPEPASGPLGSRLFTDRGYWGVFITGGVDPTYAATYEYGPGGFGSESNLQLAFRGENCMPWKDSAATQNAGPPATLTRGGFTGTEFILASLVDPRNAIDFDGTDDVITVAADPSLDLTTDATLEAWIFITNSKTAGIISRGNTTNGYFLATAPTGANANIVFSLYNTTTLYTMTSATALLPNIWYHVAAAWDSTTSMNVYINGVLDTNSGTVTGSSGTPSGNLSIGSDGSNYFQGYIDEARIWSETRSQAQIQGSMCQKLAGTETNLEGYWRFDNETDSTNCPDYSGNSNVGTMTNFADIRAARVCSSAPIGDYSAYNYSAAASTVTLNPTGDPFRATASGGTWAGTSGIHAYRLDEAPVYPPDLWDTPTYPVPPYGYVTPNGLTPPVNATPPPVNWSSVDYYRYFGVFVTDPTSGVNQPQYDVVYSYNNNPMTPTDDSVIGLARRPAYCFGTWADPDADPALTITLDTVANTIAIAGDSQNTALVPPSTGSKQNPEYVLGGKDAPLAITLASFTATAGDGCVDIKWETATEIDTVGFYLWRSDRRLGDYTRIERFISSNSKLDTQGAAYAYRDCNVDLAGITNSYYYMLQEITIDSKQKDNMHGPIGPVSENITAAQTGGKKEDSDKTCFISILSDF